MKVKAVKVNRAHYFLTDPRIYIYTNGRLYILWRPNMETLYYLYIGPMGRPYTKIYLYTVYIASKKQDIRGLFKKYPTFFPFANKV